MIERLNCVHFKTSRLDVFRFAATFVSMGGKASREVACMYVTLQINTVIDSYCMNLKIHAQPRTAVGRRNDDGLSSHMVLVSKKSLKNDLLERSRLL